MALSPMQVIRNLAASVDTKTLAYQIDRIQQNASNAINAIISQLNGSSTISASYFLTSDSSVGGVGDFQLMGFTQSWDTNNAFFGNAFHTPKSGFYLLMMQTVQSGVQNDIFGYRINNGPSVYFGTNFGNPNPRGNGAVELNLSVGDSVTLFVSPNGSCTILGNGNTFFSVTEL